jgi:hypothetical protein
MQFSGRQKLAHKNSLVLTLNLHYNEEGITKFMCIRNELSCTQRIIGNNAWAFFNSLILMLSSPAHESYAYEVRRFIAVNIYLAHECASLLLPLL